MIGNYYSHITTLFRQNAAQWILQIQQLTVSEPDRIAMTMDIIKQLVKKLRLELAQKLEAYDEFQVRYWDIKRDYENPTITQSERENLRSDYELAKREYHQVGELLLSKSKALFHFSELLSQLASDKDFSKILGVEVAKIRYHRKRYNKLIESDSSAARCFGNGNIAMYLMSRGIEKSVKGYMFKPFEFTILHLSCWISEQVDQGITFIDI